MRYLVDKVRREEIADREAERAASEARRTEQRQLAEEQAAERERQRAAEREADARLEREAAAILRRRDELERTTPRDQPRPPRGVVNSRGERLL